MSQQVEVRVGGEYEVSMDGAVYANARFWCGIVVLDDGAYAGRIIRESGVEFVDPVNEDGELVPAHPFWDRHITRAVGVPATAAVASAA